MNPSSSYDQLESFLLPLPDICLMTLQGHYLEGSMELNDVTESDISGKTQSF